MIQRTLAIWSLVPLPFLNSTWTSGSSQFMYCWSLAWKILNITLLVCEISAIVQKFEHCLTLPFFEIPWWLRDKASVCNAGDLGLIPVSGRSPREGNGYPPQYSCLGNLMDRGAWWVATPWNCKESDTTEWFSLPIKKILKKKKKDPEPHLIHPAVSWQFFLLGHQWDPTQNMSTP